MDYLLTIVPAVAVGLQVTLKIFLITIILSLPLGILMAIARISKVMPSFTTACLSLLKDCGFLISRQQLLPLSSTTQPTLQKSSAAAFSPLTAASTKGQKS